MLRCDDECGHTIKCMGTISEMIQWEAVSLTFRANFQCLHSGCVCLQFYLHPSAPIMPAKTMRGVSAR